MSIETFYILVAIGVAVWLFRSQKKSAKPPAAPPTAPEASPGAAPRVEVSADPFLGEIASVKKQVDLQVKSETDARRRELEAQYADDLDLKNRLSNGGSGSPIKCLVK